MANFNVNNSDFYYTGATGWFEDFCDRDLGNPSYLYVPVHDDQYNFTGVVGPWPYHNSGLCPDRPPTPFFSGNGQCIGCPKIASDSQYLPHRQFNSTYISNEWENIYPTFEENVLPTIPFLQTGLNVSWVNPLVYMTGRISESLGIQEEGIEAAKYYGPQIDLVAPTAYLEEGNIITPYWETNGAKIRVRYAIRGNNYARLVIGFTVEKVTKEDIQENVNYSGNAYSISVEDIINNYTYSLYYGYEDFGWSAVGANPGDFQLESSIDKPVFIFDSCAVKNVGKDLNIYGPAPGFHIRGNSRNLYTENGEFDDDNIFVRYFAFIKKEGDDEIDQSQIVRAKIDIAGFGHPKGLLGLYYDRYSHEEGANLDNDIQINRLGPCDLRLYSLNWGRGINTASTELYDLNQYARLDFEHGSSFVTGVTFQEDSPLNIGQPYAGAYNIVSNDYTECVDGRVPPCRVVESLLWVRVLAFGECSWTESIPTNLRNICGPGVFNTLRLKPLSTGLLPLLNNNPNGCFSPNLGRRGGYMSKEIFGYKFVSFIIKFKYPREAPGPLPFGARNFIYENLDKYGVPEGIFDTNRQLPVGPSLFSYSFNPQEDCLDFFGLLMSDSTDAYINYLSHEHPLFYIGKEQVFATEPNLIANVQKIPKEDFDTSSLNEYFCAFKPGVGAPGGYVHPYRKMIEFLDGLNASPSQPFVEPNSCIPKHIVTTPVSENINYYSGYVTTTEIFDSDAVSITGDNSIIVKQLGDIQLDMYNIADNNKIFNPLIISNTGLFKDDIDYIYPSNPGNLQGSPSKIIYDSGTNILYNLAPFFGYYKYNLNTKCTTYSNYLNNTVGGDGGYVDLIVKNNTIYISNIFQNKIDVINKSLEIVTHTITGVQSPVSMVLDGNRLYVGSSTSNYISIFDIQNYTLSGQINFLENESPIKLEILNNKLYTLTNSVNPNKDIVIISGINSITGIYNTYSNVGYKRLSTEGPYSLSKIQNNNYIYIGNISGIKIINSNTDTYLNTVISGFAPNIEIPDRFSDVLFSSVNEYRCNEMVFNDSDNKIYFIDKNLPAVFVLNTGTNQCEKIIDLSELVGGPGGITFESNTNNMYISTSDRLAYGTLNNFVILNNRPKANISFSETPQFISQNRYNFNITSNNNQTGILYKSDKFPYISIDKTGSITLPTGALANNFDFLVFAGQMPTSGFAYSFDAQTYRIGSTGGDSVLYSYNGYSIYNPEPNPGELKFLKPTGQLLTGSRNCDFDDNCRVVVLDNWKNNSINIYNLNNNLLQSLTGLNFYVRQIQMNRDGSLFAFSSSIGTGASIQIVTGNPSLNGSYKIKQRIGNPDYNLVSGILPRLDNFVLNRSGNIIICEGQGVNNPGISGAIFTGSVNSQWGFHSYISGSHFTISNDGSVILSAQFREYHNSKLDGVNVFTGSVNHGWKFKTALTGQVFSLPIPFIYPSFFMKNEDVIAVPFDQGVGYGFGLDFFTGSKTGGWKLKEQNRISIGSFYIDISDDGRTVHRAPRASTPFYYSENLKTGNILSFSGSKESGWSNLYQGVPNSAFFSMPTTPSPSYPRFNSKIRCHGNVVVTYSDTYDLGIDATTPSPTSFFTYNI